MDDYIKREDALSEMAKAECGLEYEECTDCSCSYICRIRDIPSADVRENVRGEWMPDLDYDGEDEWLIWECSNCGQLTESQTNFCPYCGADMRGDKS